MTGGDQEIVARVRAGDREAFRLLVERHSRDVYGLALRVTGNEQDPEDVVQESFLRAYRALDRFDERATFQTWLYRITANCALDLVRKRRGAVDAANFLDTLPAGAPSAERMALGREVHGLVRDALDGMTFQERRAFLLRHVEGRSIPEISERLNLGESAAKHSIFRAVRKLRRVLKPALAAMTILAVAFLAGRWTTTAPPARKPPGVDRASVLRQAVARHLDRSQMVLAGVANAPPGGVVNISLERERAIDILGENRLYRRAALMEGDPVLAGVLEDLELLLIEISHSPDLVPAGQFEELRGRIEERQLLFKVRALRTRAGYALQRSEQ